MNDSVATENLYQLGSGEGLPVDAIRAATADRAAMVPLFLQAFEHCAQAGPVVRDGLFFAFHLLGQWREKSAYRSLAAFLRRPTDDLEELLGDATNETSHRVMASVFDGDPNPLYELILDPEADEFVRARMCEALAMVTLRGELPREEAARFLRRCFTDLTPKEDCFAWNGWQNAVAMLGLAELKPLVKDAFDRGSIDESWLDFADFEEELQRNLDGGPPPAWQAHKEFELFGDTIEELSSWAAFAAGPETDEDEDAEQEDDDDGFDEEDDEEFANPPAWQAGPAINPFKDVGRNDPCPCGSGKKFKKCCLGKSVLPATDAAVRASRETEFAVPPAEDPTSEYDPLAAPDPGEWLALSEQERIDLIAAYHRRARIRLPNVKVHAAIHAAVETQIAMGDELPVRRAAQRLMSEGLDRHEAVHAVGSVLAATLYDLTREAGAVEQPGQPSSSRDPNAAYFAELERLTAEEWRRSG